MVAQATPSGEATAAPTPTVVESPKPAEEGVKFSHPAVWIRLNNMAHNSKDPEKVDKVSAGAEVDLLLSGQVHDKIQWQADFVATLGNYGGGIQGAASILDLIGKFELAKAFNVWFGRMLVPSDRANFAGPWFMAPWNYPGFYIAGAAPIGPYEGPFGRNDGVTAWGDFGNGKFKYYVGAFDLHQVDANPLVTARLNLALIGSEPGYYHSATYYGKDMLVLGVGAQFKKEGSVESVMAPMPGAMAPVPMTDDFQEINADVLYEKKLAMGTFDLEGCFYNFTGKYDPVKYDWFALVSYLTPKPVGPGYLQPLVRLQMAKERTMDLDWRLLDVQAGYAISQYAARLALVYQNSDIGGTKGNAIFLGIQLQK
jgi:hypothetical protein